jgi:putative DNA-invertase from lambdoid prophage Rac
MGKTLAYIRVSDDKQDVKNQRHEILEASRLKDIKIDDFISITMTSRKTAAQRGLDEVLQRLEEGDTLIVTELSRLGRNTAEIIALVNELVKRGETSSLPTKGDFWMPRPICPRGRENMLRIA